MGTTTRNSTTLDHEAMTEAEATEALAALHGDPLPSDWQEPLAIAGRQECLAGAAYAAADAALELLIVRVELGRRNDQGGEDAPLQQMLDALFALDKMWRRYVSVTQRGDAAEIVYEAAEFWGGATVATFIEGLLLGIREERRAEVARALQSRHVTLNEQAN